jgi:hypothetical protein
MQDDGLSRVTQLEDALAVARLDAEIAEARLKAETAKLKALAAKIEVEASNLQAIKENLERLNQWRDHTLRRAAGPLGEQLNDAFNGQLSKIEMFEEVVSKTPLRVALNTGVFWGQTTRYLAGRFRHVVAFEDDDRNLDTAKKHCALHPNISFAHGDSRKLKEAWKDIPIPGEEIDLAYLDARYGEICAIREELEFVLAAAPNAVIFIDDFKVDDDPDYGFGSYPSAQQDLALIKDLLKSSAHKAYWPTRAGIEDTYLYPFHRKPPGTLLLVPQALLPALKGCKTIRPVGQARTTVSSI